MTERLNPIFVQCLRSRLRKTQLLAWGGGVALIATALFFGVFLTTRMRMGASVASAARATFIPMLVLQWLILVFLGTGSVASGIAIEKDSGTLDYHRLTPMSVTSKALGYLFGLPIREYVLFAITLPFVIVAAVLGDMSFLSLAELYLVFFAGALCYHLAGLVSGMLAKRARRANWIAQMVVVVCYVILPQLARLGFTFFGYLTVMPTLRGLVVQELGIGQSLLELAMAFGVRGPDAPFFGLSLPPSVYALLVQGLVAATLLVMLLRKWRDPAAPTLSKRSALLVFTALLGLVTGSLWSTWQGQGGVHLVMGALGLGMRENAQVYFVLSLGAAVFLLWLTTPRAPQMLRGTRRARKLRLPGIPRSWDEASTTWMALAFAMVATCGYYLLLLGTRSGDEVLGRTSLLSTLALPALLFLTVLAFQAARETLGARGFLLWFALLWIAPVLVVAVIAAATGPTQVVQFLSCLSPVGAFNPMRDAAFGAAGWSAQALLALAFHGGMALWLLSRAWRGRKRIAGLADA